VLSPGPCEAMQTTDGPRTAACLRAVVPLRVRVSTITTRPGVPQMNLSLSRKIISLYESTALRNVRLETLFFIPAAGSFCIV
jgi:hypothetical protein